MNERPGDLAKGRWKEVLTEIGINARFLVKKQGPCPLCGGKTRFRFIDKDGQGTWYCNHCLAGNGIELVKKFKRVDMSEAIKLIADAVKTLGFVETKNMPRKSDNDRWEKAKREKNATLWSSAHRLDGTDLASRYLIGRGIERPQWPKYLRFLPETPLFDEGKQKMIFLPAMLAKFSAHDGSGALLHRTFLEEPGVKKADMGEKARMFMPGAVPPGGAVRLGKVSDTMGVSEGIETALSAAQLNKIPVWATCTAGALTKWIPPVGVKNIIIFGDLDASFTGQMAAYSLAYRLRNEKEEDRVTPKYNVAVRFPLFDDMGAFKDDWNDMLRREAA
jgi:putative DNA primase/helicase